MLRLLAISKAFICLGLALTANVNPCSCVLQTWTIDFKYYPKHNLNLEGLIAEIKGKTDAHQKKMEHPYYIMNIILTGVHNLRIAILFILSIKAIPVINRFSISCFRFINIFIFIQFFTPYIISKLHKTFNLPLLGFLCCCIYWHY